MCDRCPSIDASHLSSASPSVRRVFVSDASSPAATWFSTYFCFRSAACGLALGLERRDVDLPVVRAAVDLIASAPRPLDRLDHARQLLAALKAHRHLRGPLVFCTMDGTMLTCGEMKWPLWRACKRAGLRRIGWHVLRHTFASHLAMRGAPLKAIQELLGHATITMTMRYAHLAPEIARDTVRLLDGLAGHGKTMAKTADSSGN
ncbi:MAG TPA: tyrosine-type recombinase/integrase [Kofleriaceae bacterium]|nr:tyrosine-type recombinase/integrase [Kofleriaceae bacterium]